MRGEHDAAAASQTLADAVGWAKETRGQDTPSTSRLPAFSMNHNTKRLSMAKAALLRPDRDAVGTPRFYRFLHNYLQAHRWGITNTDQRSTALRDLPDTHPSPLFKQWDHRRPMQSAARGGWHAGAGYAVRGVNGFLKYLQCRSGENPTGLPALWRAPCAAPLPNRLEVRLLAACGGR